MKKGKVNKLLLLPLLLFVLVGCNNEWLLEGEEYEGKRLAVVVKMKEKSEIGLGLEVEELGERLNDKELKKITDFFKNQLESGTDLIIVNKEDVLNNEDYHKKEVQKKIKKKYNLDFLLVVNLSNIIFNANEKTNSSFSKDPLESNESKFDPPKGAEKEQYEYGCSVKIAYQIVDLSKNEITYSGEGSTYYEIDINYGSKIELLKRALIRALEETKLIT